MDAFMKDVLNVKPVLIKQNVPKWMPFSKDFLILSVKPIFCWNLMPPKPMPFMSKMLSTLNLFCLTQCPQNGCLYERWSQCEASSFKRNAREMDAFQQRLFNSQRETYFLLKPDAPKTNAFHVKDVVNIEPFLFDTMPPKWMPLWKMFSVWSQFF